LSKALIF
jgi:chromosome segregation ATPase